ncbi:hypothetical protein WJM97_21935 [Okeanomitos corallinicola TIOX110]|uniref:SpoVT-AbrB domain-containing protein n=1 Tax=Okeanomitos corallinicola TIOX110 TaxID=3133117 RepID=A0ABZ2UT14_9CYAN
MAKVGPPATVLFGEKEVQTTSGKKKRKLFVRLPRKTAEFFGLPIEKDASVEVTRKGKKFKLPIRGSNSVSIKVRAGGSDDKPKYKNIPVPAGSNIEEIREFILTKITKNKPDRFATPNGITWDVNEK